MNGTIMRFPLHRYLTICVSAALLAYLLWSLDLSVVVTRLSGANPVGIVLATGLIGVSIFASQMRWFAMVRIWSRQSYLWHLRNFMIATFLSAFTPGSLGADAYRIYSVGKREGNHWLITGLIMRERLVGLIGFAVLMIVGIVVFSTNRQPSDSMPVGDAESWLVAALTGSTLVALGIAAGLTSAQLAGRRLVDFLPTSTGETAHRTLDGLRFKSWSELVQILSLTAALLGAWFVAGMILVETFDAKLPLGLLACLLSLCEIARFLPISAQGIGVREVVFAKGAMLFGYDYESAFLVVATLYLLNTLVQVLWWLAVAPIHSGNDDPQAADDRSIANEVSKT